MNAQLSGFSSSLREVDIQISKHILRLVDRQLHDLPPSGKCIDEPLHKFTHSSLSKLAFSYKVPL